MCGSIAPLHAVLEQLLNPYESFEEEETVFDPIEDNGLVADTPPDDTDEERLWAVYRGIQRPYDDDDWRRVWAYCANELFIVTGVEYEFCEWEDAWEFLHGEE
jgi:hypothetical protein